MTRSALWFPRLTRAAFVIAGALPWLVPALRGALPPTAGSLLDLLFFPVCHRLPARTLVLSGVAMPLCSRCAGLFAGVALGALLRWPALPLGRWRRWMALFAGLMLVDIVTQDLHLHPVWHPTRILTGALFGYAVAAATIDALYRNAEEDAAATQ